MPYSPPSLCTKGCGTLVYGGGQCPTCLSETRKERDAGRPSAAVRGYDRTWAKARREYLNDHRECESDDCAHIPWPSRPAATDVDHVDGLGPLGPRGYDESNFRALCHSCHSRTTATRDGGFGHPKR